MNLKKEAAAIQKRIDGLQLELAKAETRCKKKQYDAQAELDGRRAVVKPIIAQLEATLKALKANPPDMRGTIPASGKEAVQS